MTLNDMILILPLIVLSSAILLVMLAIAIHRSPALTYGLSILGVILAWISLLPAWQRSPQVVTTLLKIDHLGLFYIGLILLATFVTLLISPNYFSRQEIQSEEYYLLLLLATLGSATLAVSNHFVALFLGLEILSISLYGMVGYLRDRAIALEAAIKYLVMAAVSARFLMFGVALIYANQGTLVFDQLKLAQPGAGLLAEVMILAGFGLVFVGVGFKLSLVPFHMWSPDVYQGAPAPVAGFIATVSKGAVFAVLLRLALGSAFLGMLSLQWILTLLAVFSMLIGNLLALRQSNVKRILAYSSVAHMGYIVTALIANSAIGVAAATFYLAAYFVTTLTVFGVISLLSTCERDADEMEDYRSLFWRRGGIAIVMTLALLSLIGIPFTAGFIGKLYVLAAGVDASRWLLAFVLVTGSAIGLYYYLRIIVSMFRQESEEANLAEEAFPEARHAQGFQPLGYLLGLLSVILIGLGVFPGPLIGMIQAVVGAL